MATKFDRSSSNLWKFYEPFTDAEHTFFLWKEKQTNICSISTITATVLAVLQIQGSTVMSSINPITNWNVPWEKDLSSSNLVTYSHWPVAFGSTYDLFLVFLQCRSNMLNAGLDCGNSSQDFTRMEGHLLHLHLESLWNCYCQSCILIQTFLILLDI